MMSCWIYPPHPVTVTTTGFMDGGVSLIQMISLFVKMMGLGKGDSLQIWPCFLGIIILYFWPYFLGIIIWYFCEKFMGCIRSVCSWFTRAMRSKLLAALSPKPPRLPIRSCAWRSRRSIFGGSLRALARSSYIAFRGKNAQFSDFSWISWWS